MKKINNLLKSFLTVLFVFCIFKTDVLCCNLKIISEDSRQWIPEYYNLYYFRADKKAKFEEYDKLVDSFEAKWIRYSKANIWIKRIENTADLDAANKDLKLKKNQRFVFLLASPSGKIIWSRRYGKKVTIEDIENIIASPMKTKIAESLKKKNNTVLLYVSDRKSEEAKKLYPEMKSVLKICEELYNITVSILWLDTNDVNESFLLKNLEIPQGDKNISVAFLLGNAKVMFVLKDKTITKDQILDRMRAANWNCSCMNSPESYGEDLLMETISGEGN
ncbi:MAG: hypothetical protein KKG87_04150 [Elusimicrobia bacterium]|nr:hypothetical protein [Elusimicrobiota bacterium]